MSYPFEKCSALLPMMGAHNGTDFPDFSPAPRTFTAYGGAKTVTDAASPYGSRALFESNGYLSAPHDPAWMFPSGTDFTIEKTIEFASVATDQFIMGRWGTGANSTQAWLVMWEASTNLLRFDFRDSNGSTYRTTNAPWTPSAGVIYKVAIARQGTTYYFFSDGALLGSVVNTASIRQVNLALDVGALRSSGPYAAGLRMHDLRITTGEAIYTEAYIPLEKLYDPFIGRFHGTVRDKNGALAQRRVILTRDSTGECVGTVLSDPVTGEYEIPDIIVEEPHTLIFTGEADRNALVYTGVMPEEIP